MAVSSDTYFKATIGTTAVTFADGTGTSTHRLQNLDISPTVLVADESAIGSDSRIVDSGEVYGHSGSFTVKRIADNAALFGATGKKIAWERGLEGNGSGKVKETGSGVILSSVPTEDGNGIQIYNVSWQGGKVTYGAY